MNFFQFRELSKESQLSTGQESIGQLIRRVNWLMGQPSNRQMKENKNRQARERGFQRRWAPAHEGELRALYNLPGAEGAK